MTNQTTIDGLEFHLNTGIDGEAARLAGVDLLSDVLRVEPKNPQRLTDLQLESVRYAAEVMMKPGLTIDAVHAIQRNMGAAVLTERRVAQNQVLGS